MPTPPPDNKNASTPRPSFVKKERPRSSDKEGAGYDGARRHEQRTKPGLAARGAALDVLRLVRRGRSLDDALAACRSFYVLEGPDRGFARHLATTCLRRQGSLDGVVEHFLNSPLKADQHELRALLRLGAAQLTLLDVAPHAAASTTVDLARERGDTRGFAKLVNALCRRMAEKGKDVLAQQSPRADTPGWLWRSWERAYGPARTKKMAAAHRVEPPLDITLKPDANLEEWAERLEGEVIGPQSIRRQDGGKVEELPGYEEGAWWVQDVASTLPALLAGDVSGQLVYDLCAAPGGKTLQFSAAGAQVKSVDISSNRIQRLFENLNRTSLSAQVVASDVLDWTPDEKADVVLLDAPCTATGTIRRHPDLLWSKQEKELKILATLQDRMIDHAVQLVKPGGMLIFATCSLMQKEGEERVAEALARHPALRRRPVTLEEVGNLPVLTKDGDVRCLPSALAGQGGMDGFYSARLELTDAA
ncbi:MAG: RsmB/NOP family class I SAM-dependent RNA methyltransferase [Pseudomonadota bacterium]